jgi:diacylglycerol kinase (ATP)
VLRPKNPIDSFRFALNGILLSFRTQRHLRIHFGVAVLALIAGFVWRLSRVELLILVIAISMVLLAELFNTALETVVDLVTMDYHPLAKVAKDVAAGAVLVTTINAAMIGAVLFLDTEQIQRLFLHPAEIPADVVRTLVVGFTLLLLLLVILKQRGKHGRFLHGGIVSGHSAIAFFLCTSLMMVARQPLISLLAVLLALLVAQSRVDAGIHSVREVALGALLGILIPVTLHAAIPMLLQAIAQNAPVGTTG